MFRVLELDFYAPVDGRMKRKQELRHDAAILAKQLDQRTRTVRENAQDVRSELLQIILFQNLFIVQSRAAHSKLLSVFRGETSPINAERTRKPGPRSQMESGVRRLVSDNGDRSYVLVGARSNFWSDGDLLGEVESHHTTGALGIEVRTAWLEHTVESSDTDQAAVIE